MRKPVIAVPLGDPAGIGPEIVVKALQDPRLRDARIIVIGDMPVVEQACRICGAEVALYAVCNADDAVFAPGRINVLPMETIDMASFRFGEISAMCGKAAYAYIEKSIALALLRQVDAVATPPVNKESLRLGDIDFIGHTEIFGSLTGAEDPLTMFQVENLRVFFLTRHVSLRQACDLVTKDRIIDYVRRCRDMLRRLGVTGGTMAVAGLNPHSGEHGLFGDEDEREIRPAIEALRAEGFDVAGPIGADSVFHLARTGVYDSVLSLYHDQGHIACKTLDFNKTIAVTGGIPILRTSVDHGTAFDIAGKGIASEVSMVEAILKAQDYAPYYAAI